MRLLIVEILCGDVDVQVNVDNYLIRKFYDHDFQLKPESNSKNFKPEILLSVFSLMVYYIFLKPNRELRIKIFEFVTLILVLNVIKYFNHSEVYDGIKTCSQLHFVTYESINTHDTVETSCLHSDLVFFSQFLKFSTGTLISIYCYYSQLIWL